MRVMDALEKFGKALGQITILFILCRSVVKLPKSEETKDLPEKLSGFLSPFFQPNSGINLFTANFWQSGQWRKGSTRSTEVKNA